MENLNHQIFMLHGVVLLTRMSCVYGISPCFRQHNTLKISNLLSNHVLETSCPDFDNFMFLIIDTSSFFWNEDNE